MPLFGIEGCEIQSGGQLKGEGFNVFFNDVFKHCHKPQVRVNNPMRYIK